MGAGRRRGARQADSARLRLIIDRAEAQGSRGRWLESAGHRARERGDLRLVDAQDVAWQTAHISWQSPPASCATSLSTSARAAIPEARRRCKQGDLRRGARRYQRADSGFVALDDALQALAKFDERKSRVVELRFFAALTVDETASVLKVSADTVMRDWRARRSGCNVRYASRARVMPDANRGQRCDGLTHKLRTAARVCHSGQPQVRADRGCSR